MFSGLAMGALAASHGFVGNVPAFTNYHPYNTNETAYHQNGDFRYDRDGRFDGRGDRGRADYRYDRVSENRGGEFRFDGMGTEGMNK